MRHMRSLQFLEIEGYFKLEKMPSGMGKLTGLRRLSKFIVGETEDGTGIGELGELSLLEGELKIRGLDKVNGLVDAKGAKLKCKQNLNFLTLEWRRSFQNDGEVLEGLEPHPSLKKLHIDSFRGLKLASWMVNLVNLVELMLLGCRKLEILPQLGKLPVLGVLRISCMDALKSFDDEDNVFDCHDNSSSSSLQRGGGGGDSDAMIHFPSLQALYINDCPSLTGLPYNMPMLKHLEIRSCERLIVLPSDLPKLDRSSISRCYDLVSLPDGMGMGSFPLLSSLSISGCPKLKCLPDGLQHLKALKFVSIPKCELLSTRCEKDKGQDWPKIAHLPYVKIDYKVIQDSKV